MIFTFKWNLIITSKVGQLKKKKSQFSPCLTHSIFQLTSFKKYHIRRKKKTATRKKKNKRRGTNNKWNWSFRKKKNKAMRMWNGTFSRTNLKLTSFPRSSAILLPRHTNTQNLFLSLKRRHYCNYNVIITINNLLNYFIIFSNEKGEYFLIPSRCELFILLNINVLIYWK